MAYSYIFVGRFSCAQIDLRKTRELELSHFLYSRICQSKKSTFSTGSSSRKSQSKKFHAHRIVHPTTKHTPTRPYQVPHCSIIQGADAGVAITAAACRSKSAWRIPSSACQQRLSHDGSSARYRSHAANNGCACCSFGGSRLSATPRTLLYRLSANPIATDLLGRGFVEPLLAEKAREA